jgi:hypothetical protein
VAAAIMSHFRFTFSLIPPRLRREPVARTAISAFSAPSGALRVIPRAHGIVLLIKLLIPKSVAST